MSMHLQQFCKTHTPYHVIISFFLVSHILQQKKKNNQRIVIDFTIHLVLIETRLSYEGTLVILARNIETVRL